ncbi:MAG: hypothetical protein R6V85_20285 [Polyangia bacterium]
MSRVRVEPLECPECGNPLSGLRYDVLFGCTSCGLAFCFESEQRRAFRVRRAAAEIERPGPRLYLPLWELRVQSAVPAADRARESLVGLATSIERLWVSGFRTRHPQLFKDPGRELSGRRIEASEDPDPPARQPLLGACRGPATLERRAELYVLDRLDKRADITRLDIELKVGEMRLWQVPFAVEREKLVELLAGTALPRHLFEDLPEIERALAT